MSGSAVVQECSSDPWGNVEHVIQAAAGITFSVVLTESGKEGMYGYTAA